MRKYTVFFVLCWILLGCMTIPGFAMAEDAAATSINLTPVVQAVITLLAALVTYRLVPWIKARTTEQKQANLSALASTLVFAAEQLYGANRGQEKLAYVTSILREHGYDVDSQEVLATVEAAVNQMVPYQELHAVEAENTQQNSAN